MEDGDTESENASRVIQDFVFWCWKWVVSMGTFCRYIIKSSITPDPGYHMGKSQKHGKHRKQEPRGQPFPSRWPQGSNEDAFKVFMQILY